VTGQLALHAHSFAAMGVVVELIVEGADAAVAAAAHRVAEQRVHDLAACFTRFDASSELMQLNQVRRAVVSAELFELIEHAMAAREATGGRFDPTIHDALIAAGYDRTFTELASPDLNNRADTDDTELASPDLNRLADTDHIGLRTAPEVQLDAASRTVTLAPGASLDLGGIAKGYIADIVCALLSATGAALVNAGGDIACSQRAHDELWSIEVDLVVPAGMTVPHPNDEPLVLTLDAGGIATSGITRRRWLDPRSGTTRHHVIDPLTGVSVRTDAASVTVVADSCTSAEVWATALLIAGTHAAVEGAQAAGIAAMICCVDGSVVFTGALA